MSLPAFTNKARYGWTSVKLLGGCGAAVLGYSPTITSTGSFHLFSPQITSALHKTDQHFDSDDVNNQVILPIAPPPAPFMDSHNYGKVKSPGQEQHLGSVPEEEESDWSELGDEPRFILTGSNRGQRWRHQDQDADKDSESGGEEVVRRLSPRPLQIPHLQFTIHNEILPVQQSTVCHPSFKNLPEAMTGEGVFRLATSPNLGSTLLIRSASLEEIPLACHQLQNDLRDTDVLTHLHQTADQTLEDLDNEIIHHWKTSNGRDPGTWGAVETRIAEADGSLLNHFMSESQPGEVRGWTGGVPEEVLKGEQTQL